MKLSAAIAAFNRLALWHRHVRVEGFTILAPTFDRCLYLWLHRLGRMGREECAWLEQAVRPGMHVADVGANIGLYTLWIARLVGSTGRVYAFEPDPLMVDALRDNIAANGAAQVEIFPCAAGAATGNVLLQRNAMNSGDNRVGATTGTALHDEQVRVPIRSLDDALAGRRVDFVKMDVQGWEGDVIRGLSGLLDANPGLQIYFEFWPHGLDRAGTPIARLAEILGSLRLRAMRPENLTPVDLERLAAELAPKGYTNLVATR